MKHPPTPWRAIMGALALMILCSPPIKAATFVGNGGNAYELDYQLTLASIHDAALAMRTSGEADLCNCAETVEHEPERDVVAVGHPEWRAIGSPGDLILAVTVEITNDRDRRGCVEER